MLPAGVARAELAAIPRDKTMTLIGINSRDGRWVDYELWNPYAIGANHQNGPNLIYEPLAYYSAFADKMYMWLAESYEYTPDFKQLTIKTRQGIKWSDGTPFSAEDVAYTFNTLRDLGPKVKWGVDVNQALDEATVTDPNTVVLKFKIPSPRFFFFATYKYDIGIYMVPKHIFQGQDWTSFKHFDLAKGWPVTTGPWKVVESSLQQKVFDRRDTWWAAEQKLAPMPQILRNIWLPYVGEQETAQAVITNQVDSADHCSRRPSRRCSGKSEDHHPCRAEAALGLCRLVADLAVRQQRREAVRRQGRALGAQPLYRSPAADPGGVSRGLAGVRAADAAL